MADDPEFDRRARRLAEALVQAARSKEYVAAAAAWDAGSKSDEDGWDVWLTLASVALRDGRKSIAFVDDMPNERIPGFGDANAEITAATGKVVQIWTEPTTHRVTRVELVPSSSKV